ncbi:MAG TPA: hypothetical protein EYP55_10935, partial [Anaerolineae bacterium]|nr:hypothetical protein [Anaerolineae bacterium]
MLKLHVVQAEHGDCLMLEYDRPSNPRYILIDGGPATIYEEHLRGKLLEIRASGGRLDLAAASHVDDDHIRGLLDLMTELRQQRDGGAAETIAIGALWHNTFSQTLGSDIEARFRMLMEDVVASREVMILSDRMDKSIRQGDQLTQFAAALRIPINPEFASHHLICVDEAPGPIVLGNLSLHVVGPTRENLERLRKDWLDWLEKHERDILARDPTLAERAAREADQSIPNLSSIMTLAEAEGKTILL